MKVLMLGWEFPPFKSGGLGTACKDLTTGLVDEGVEVIFVMPRAPEGASADNVKIIGTNNFTKFKIKVRQINTTLTPYQTSRGYKSEVQTVFKSATSGKEVYGKNIYEEVERYTMAAREIAEQEDFDVIHAHDWMTYHAGMEVKKVSGKPLIVHIHATEFDRTAGNPNNFISHREFVGMDAADQVIANSEFTKSNVLKHYLIDPDKIKVVHWGIESSPYPVQFESPIDNGIVLFLGRITVQKGPEYFIEAARRTLEIRPNTKFVMAGSGDKFQWCVDKVAELGIADKFIFTGFLRGDDVHKAFQMADLFVMPSVSEPFGLVALEALKNKTPIIISKQSGVSEVLDHALKVNFWDTDELANKIISSLNYKELISELKQNSYQEVQKFNLRDPARKVAEIYNEALS